MPFSSWMEKDMLRYMRKIPELWVCLAYEITPMEKVIEPQEDDYSRFMTTWDHWVLEEKYYKNIIPIHFPKVRFPKTNILYFAIVDSDDPLDYHLICFGEFYSPINLLEGDTAHFGEKTLSFGFDTTNKRGPSFLDKLWEKTNAFRDCEHYRGD